MDHIHQSNHYGGRVQLLFNEKSHTYKASVDGKRPQWIPGVSGVKGYHPGKPDGLLGWAETLAAEAATDYVLEHLEEAQKGLVRPMAVEAGKAARKTELARTATLGHLTHAWAEQYIRFMLGEREEPESHANDHVRRLCGYFLQWVEDVRLEPIAAEFRCLSLEHWFAGTSDLDANIPGIGRCAIDFKTSNAPGPGHAVQIAGYQVAREEEFDNIQYDAGIIACFPRDGDEFISMTRTRDHGDHDIFLRARESYKIVKPWEKAFWQQRYGRG